MKYRSQTAFAIEVIAGRASLEISRMDQQLMLNQ
jgi:hypothetical protein